jgi:hypothetical protein
LLSANRYAVALPIPAAAPVTIAVFPSNDNSLESGVGFVLVVIVLAGVDLVEIVTDLLGILKDDLIMMVKLCNIVYYLLSLLCLCCCKSRVSSVLDKLK